MRKITLYMLLVAATQLAWGQTMPLDFSDAADAFTTFGGSQFSFESDPEDASNPVGRMANNGTQPWQGFYIDLSSGINLSSDNIVTLSFYQFDTGGHSIIVKLEQGTGPDIEVDANVSGQGWKRDLSFDFSNALVTGSSNVINATGSYDRLTIFIDGAAPTTAAFLIDDINNNSEPIDPNELDVIYDELVWADEFDGSNGPINDLNWFHQTQLPSGGSWFNGEVQHYTNRIQNSFVEDGNLHIVAIKEDFTDQGETKQYTSARLNSKFAFTYGRVDVMAKLPFGDGTWPAIWTLGKNISESGAYWQTQGFGTTPWPDCGELDIMEHGLHADNEVSCAIHTPSSFGATVNTETKQLADVANTYHLYSMNWSPDEIAFMVDNEVIFRYNPAVKNASTWPFDEDQYLILNIAMGGISGAIDPAFTQSSMVIDYVRVYQSSQLSTADVELTPVSLHPNPASNVVHIKSSLDIERVEVFNMLGQNVISERNVGNDIDVSNLPKGIYVVNLFSGNQQNTLRLIKD